MKYEFGKQTGLYRENIFTKIVGVGKLSMVKNDIEVVTLEEFIN